MLSVIRIHIPHNLACKSIISWGEGRIGLLLSIVLRAE